MTKILKLLFLCLAISTLLNGGPVMADEKDIIHMTLKDGVVKIETRPDLAPKHVAVSYTHLTLPTIYSV